MNPRIIYLHGNGGTSWKFAWAPWLRQELSARGYATVFETFPDSRLARSEFWLPFLRDTIRAGENDVLVGWSSGAVAAMRYAERYAIQGSVLVAPSHTDLGDPSERLSGYFDAPWDWKAIKSHQRNIAVVHSDNDPLIPLVESEFIAAALEPAVIRVPGGGHFIERQTFPEVLAYLLQTYPVVL